MSLVSIRDGGEFLNYNPNADITGQIEDNFAHRGTDVARLVLATLTETPYSPTIGGVRFAVELPNGHGHETPDTPLEARVALRAYIGARVPGAAALRLQRYPTNYRGILRGLLPRRRDPRVYKDAFEEGLAGEAEHRAGLTLTADLARRIVNGAPKNINGIRLTDRNITTPDSCQTTHPLITEHGRVLTVRSLSYTAGDKTDTWYFLPQTTDRLDERGGRAPGPGMGRLISERVVDLRTAHTAR